MNNGNISPKAHRSLAGRCSGNYFYLELTGNSTDS